MGARARGDAGFTLLETVLAVGLLAIVVTGLTGLLAASFTATGLSRQRTIAQQAAMDQVESIRRMAYSSIGTPNGNPTGTLTTQAINKAGFAGTVTFKVKYVSDPAPTSYTTLADYKKVTVTVARSSDSRVMANDVTYVAPPGRANYGGINNATVVAQVIDMGNNTPVSDVNVSLTSTTPAAALGDLTDGAGKVTFPALTANPDSSKFYDLALTAPTGYQALTDDLSPAAAAHHSLSPGETFSTALRIYRPATLNLAFTDAAGAAWGGTSTVTVSSSRQTQVFTVTGSSYSFTSLNGEPVIPGLQYTVVAKSTTPLCGNPPAKYVPDTYPTVLTSTITSQMIACPSGTLVVTVKRSNGTAAPGATVTVTGGPNNINFTATANASGIAPTLTVPTGSNYTIKAWSCGLADASKSKTQTAVTIASGANNQTLTFNSASCPAP